MVKTDNVSELSFVDGILNGNELTLGINEWTEIGQFYVCADGSKDGLSLGRSAWTPYGKILVIILRILID